MLNRMNEAQSVKLNDLLGRSELDQESRDLMQQFFGSIASEPQFDKILDLLSRFPSLFDNFCKCFQLKKEFLSRGKTEAEWNAFLRKEEEVFENL